MREDETTNRSGKLSPEEVRRYGRHLVLPEIGEPGQLALRSASVLLVGTGGLGAPAGLYLAAAGVGRIGLVDFDTVEASNLQRQIAFGTRDLGRAKTEAARERLRDLNPAINIETYQARLDRHNAIDIMRDYNVIVDGSDNFATRYLVNDTAVILDKSVVYGSVYRFEGQVSVFHHAGGPCYRCLFPQPPRPGAVPSCVTGGVLGVLPGVMGSLQANETIKIITGAGECLSGRLLLFDGLNTRFREIAVPRSAACAVCGDAPTITAPLDYDDICGSALPDVPEITAAELRDRLDGARPPLLIDVREPYEAKLASLGGVLIPLAELEQRSARLPRDRDIVLYCRTGIRSATAAKILIEAGFPGVRHLHGGIYAWSDEVDGSIVKY